MVKAQIDLAAVIVAFIESGADYCSDDRSSRYLQHHVQTI